MLVSTVFARSRYGLDLAIKRGRFGRVYRRALIRTPVQDAILSLRKNLRLTQAALAQRMGVTDVTVCRWETSRPPERGRLAALEMFASATGQPGIAAAFRQARERVFKKRDKLRGYAHGSPAKAATAGTIIVGNERFDPHRLRRQPPFATLPTGMIVHPVLRRGDAGAPRADPREHQLTMIEIQFLEEPDRNQAFFRIGTDPGGMVKPVAVDLAKLTETSAMSTERSVLRRSLVRSLSRRSNGAISAS